MDDLPNDAESEIKLFADDVSLLVRPLSKEITQTDLNKLSYKADMKQLKFNIEICKVIHFEY